MIRNERKEKKMGMLESNCLQQYSLACRRRLAGYTLPKSDFDQVKDEAFHSE